MVYTLGHYNLECYNKDLMKIYHYVEKLFKSWKGSLRKLTLIGKCTVIVSLALTKL